MLKIYYRVTCYYITKEPEHFHRFDVGIFDSREKAEEAIESVKDKPGFCAHQDKLKIKRRLKLRPPKLLNRIYWNEGFVTYTYDQ